MHTINVSTLMGDSSETNPHSATTMDELFPPIIVNP